LTLLAVGLSVTALYRFPPLALPYESFDLSREGARVPALLAQLHDPVHWQQSYNFGWTQRGLAQALRWRMLIPVVAHDLRLTDRQYLWLPWVGSFILLALVGWYAWRSSHDVIKFAATVGLFVTSSAWSSGIWGLGCMDPFYLVGLLLVSFSPSPLAVLAACLFCPWIDERFLLALPLCAALRGTDGRGWWWPLLGVLPYCGVRLAALLAGDTGISDQIAMQGAAFWRFAIWLPIGWWHGWRAAWPLIVLALILVWHRESRLGRWLLASGVACLLVIYFLAWDSSRSIAVLLPFMVYGVSRFTSRPWVLCLLVALNFILPTTFVTATRSPTGEIVPSAASTRTTWFS